MNPQKPNAKGTKSARQKGSEAMPKTSKASAHSRRSRRPKEKRANKSNAEGSRRDRNATMRNETKLDKLNAKGMNCSPGGRIQKRRFIKKARDIGGECTHPKRSKAKTSEGENERKVRTSKAGEIQRCRNARTRNEAEDIKSNPKRNEGNQACETES
jgi:hypothetical protein